MGRSDLKGKSVAPTVHWAKNSHPWNKPRGKLAGGKKKKAVVYQLHHPNKELYPEWTIRLRRNHHLFIWRQVQGLSINEQNQIDLMNLCLAVWYEIDRRATVLSEAMAGQSNEQPQPG